MATINSILKDHGFSPDSDPEWKVVVAQIRDFTSPLKSYRFDEELEEELGMDNYLLECIEVAKSLIEEGYEVYPFSRGDRFQVARDTYSWVVESGRLSAEGIVLVKSMGYIDFIKTATQKWEAEGKKNYMNGMKVAMWDIIWP